MSTWVDPGVSSEVLKFGLMRTFFPSNGSIFRRSRHFFTPSARESVLTRTTRDFPPEPAACAGPIPAGFLLPIDTAVPPRVAAPADSAAPPAMPAPATKNSLRVIPPVFFMIVVPPRNSDIDSNLSHP